MMLSSTSLSSASAWQAYRSPAARRPSISAYSTCSGLGDNASLAQRAVDHRAPDLRPPLDKRLVHHDHIHRSTEAAQDTSKPDLLGETVLHLALDDQEVEVAALVGVAASVRAEQDHLGGCWRGVDQGTSGALDQLASGNCVHRRRSLTVVSRSTEG